MKRTVHCTYKRVHNSATKEPRHKQVHVPSEIEPSKIVQICLILKYFLIVNL